MANPRIAMWLMVATYVVGAGGAFIGFATLNQNPPSLAVATLLAVGAGGIISFVRHSIFHHSDAVRMRWQMSGRNNFQIEVGLANLAWGLLGVLAVVLKWGLAVQAASFLVFGFYLGAVTVMLLTTPSHDRTRPWAQVIGMGAFAVVLMWLGFAGMAAA